MIYIFTGNDRPKIQSEIKKLLGEDYEVFDGENLTIQDIYNICLGNSLFSTVRKILIKDLTPPTRKSASNELSTNIKSSTNTNPESQSNSTEWRSNAYEILADLTNTKHTIVVWESNVPLKKSYKDFIKNNNVKVSKYEISAVDKWATFRIFDLAYTDGEKAVKELKKLISKSTAGENIEGTDPYLTVGAFSSSALKKFEQNPSTKNRKVLKNLSTLDIQIKTTAMDSWVLVESFLLKISKL